MWSRTRHGVAPSHDFQKSTPWHVYSHCNPVVVMRLQSNRQGKKREEGDWVGKQVMDLETCRRECALLRTCFFDNRRNSFCLRRSRPADVPDTAPSTTCTVLKGVTRVLHDVFWPTFDWSHLHASVAHDEHIPYQQMGFSGNSAYLDGCLHGIQPAATILAEQTLHAQLEPPLTPTWSVQGGQANAPHKTARPPRAIVHNLRTCLRASKGRAAGTKIDTECSDMIRLGTCSARGDVPHARSVMHYMSAQDCAPHSRWTEAVGHANGWNPLTVRIFRFLYDCGWKPVIGQLAVGSLAWHLGTGVDMVWCQCSSNTTTESSVQPTTQPHTFVTKLVAIELKVWQAQTYSKHRHYMQRPLQNTPCSPRNQHQLQVALTRTLMLKTLQDTPLHALPVDAYIVRVDASSIQLIPLENWASHAMTLTGPRLATRSTRVRRSTTHADSYARGVDSVV